MGTVKDRIMEISKKYHLSHISSCITSADIMETAYQLKKHNEPFILSNGHAGLALYCVLEKYEGKNAEELWLKHGTHPNLDPKNGIYCSSGSLGMAFSVALGMALSDRLRDVYCLTSDGEWAEGSMWETLRLAADLRVANLIVLVNANGYSALGEIDLDRLEWRIGSFVREHYPKVSFIRTENPEGYEGVKGHYTKA
jgi:transketolase